MLTRPTRVRFRSAFVLAAICSAALSPAPAHAARTWTDPVALTPADVHLTDWATAITASDEMIVAWADGQHSETATLHVAIAASDGSEEPAETLAQGGVRNPAIATDGSGGALLTWQHDGGIYVSERPGAGSSWTTTYLGAGAFPQIAVNARGDAAVLFTTTGGVVYLSARPAGGTWSTPSAVSPTSLPASTDFTPASAVAVTPAGAIVVAWEGDNGEYARVRWTDGTLGAVQTLARSRRPVAPPRVAVDGSGRAIVSWVQAPLGEIGPVRASVAGADGVFGLAFNLGGHASPGDTPPQALVLPDGRVTVIWSGLEPQQQPGTALLMPIQAATGDLASGTFAPAHPVSSGMARDMSPAVVDPAGQASVFFVDHTSSELHVARLSADGALLSEDRVSCQNDASSPSAAVDSHANVYLFGLHVGFAPARLWFRRDMPSSSPAAAGCARVQRYLRIDPNPGQPGEPIHFDASDFVEPDAAVNDFQWDFEGDGRWTDTGSDPRPAHIYQTAGMYLMHYRFSHTDSGGAGYTEEGQHRVAIGVQWPGSVPPAITPSPPILLRSLSAPVRISRRVLLAKGVSITLVPGRSANLTASLSTTRRARGRSLARTRRPVRLSADVRRSLRLRPTRTVSSRLRHARRVFISVRLAAAGQAGNKVTVLRAVRLTR